MDSFNVDMELLRRIGEIRKAVEQLDASDPSSTHPLLAALAQVRERARDDSTGLLKLLELVEWTAVSAAEDQRTPTSRVANGILAAAGAAEQAVFSGEGAESRALIDQAGSTLLLAAGMDPGDWVEWERPGWEPTAEEAAGPSSDPTVPGVDEGGKDGGRTEPYAGPESGVTLDDAAAFLVRMDPEDRSQALELMEILEAMETGEGPPEELVRLHQEMVSVLESVTKPARTKKALRREAVERVGELLEEAVLLLEELEGSRLQSPSPGAEGLSTPRAGGQEDTEATGAGAEEAPPGAAGFDSATGGDPEPTPDREEDGTDDTFSEVTVTSTGGNASTPAVEIDEFPESEPLPQGTDPDLVRDFVTEGFEYLEHAEEALLSLESDPRDKEAVNVVFRAFHTIKGVSGFLELHRISDLAHHAESLLSKVRDDELSYTGAVADLSLRGIDVLKALLESVSDAMEDGILRLTPDFGPLFTVLEDPDLPEKIRNGSVDGVRRADAAESDSDGSDEGGGTGGTGDAEREGGRRTKGAESSVRVRTDRLDRLVDMVGELVIAHSMLAQDPKILMDRGGLSRKVDHSAKILRELQDLSTTLRMVPLKPAFRKVTRVVRDLSKKIGKPVELVTEGEDTEIDRTMVDVLGDPLVHMVRNSLDHGLEAPDERAAAGKSKKGKIRISAYQAGGNVVIEVADDGRGLNREKILAKAIERGVVESDRGMTDREIYNLIFAPGFSTAEKVTEVSGRGVGMDVVRRNVESLRGRVSIDSEPGRGSVFSIHLPLTLAITDGMVIRVGSQRYIIPSVKIHMSMRPDREAISTVSGKGEMVMIQGSLLPIIRLHRLWSIPDAVEDPTQGLLVIVGEGRHRSALLVDELVTQQQFVVKPLSGVVADTQGVAGGAIMGNGDVGLILDPDGIIAMAHGLSHSAAA